ncbi:hypothetical protein A2303_01030 [Candidatus Falkowbacteria bacterium RIFOXYB2_FULL_47_14]|uniref:Phage holin family protein n=1 Tax=Candidatus Falkowbacteria bacterium RIFOXYA2_FULL_47_19 TaxID=1797994 RepID=A0A1F5SG08_9BACT|nr:MAG: hypothetical protein A2227_00230 [Candidatus Falkowbacteria bacterium RIFOXYA2_FULL_47_19]OGF35569.1 MAG: hypothetical protein A2468_06045 [Candidatus Falkowbacteria bacterium RIFOXYC2_FULL_46_15]OGF42948.1 MAG: hypothetical protein A2303_01030 [Candidatus Falkowbacteria bacterium RIFOXYB2_FULL_47_14]
MEILISWAISALIILAAGYLLPGIKISGFFSALLVALVLGIINAFIKPLLLLLTLPINILTLGLFTLVINALLVMLVAAIVPGFQVKNFWWALLFSVCLWAANWLMSRVFT